MKKIVFYLSLLTSCIVLAQPGYRGRRLSVQYRPGFNFHSNSAVIVEKSALALLPTAIYHSGYVEYVVGRKVTLGAQFARCSNRIDMSNDVSSVYNTYNYFAPGRLIDNELEIILKKFKNKPGNLAPFGSYVQWSFSKHWYKLSSEKFDQVLAANSNAYSVGVALGKQYIVKDVVVVDLNVQFSLSFRSSKSPEEANGLYVTKEAYSYINSQNLLGFNLGIGYLVPKLKK